MNLTPEAFDAEFDILTDGAWRLEALPEYLVPGEAALLQAIDEGAPRPERSVVTNRWLARMALTTVRDGITWARTRVVDDPPTRYQLQQLEHAYLESQTAGERILIARRGDLPASPGRDAWLLDAGTSHGRAILMKYDLDGRWLGADLTTNPDEIAQLLARRRWIDKLAVPLNVFLAALVRSHV